MVGKVKPLLLPPLTNRLGPLPLDWLTLMVTGEVKLVWSVLLLELLPVLPNGEDAEPMVVNRSVRVSLSAVTWGKAATLASS